MAMILLPPPPLLLLSFCIVTLSSVAIIPIGITAFTPSLVRSHRASVVTSRANSSRERMQMQWMLHNDDNDAHGSTLPSSNKLLSLLSSGATDDDDGKALVRKEIAALESAFLHMSNNHDITNNCVAANMMNDDNNSQSPSAASSSSSSSSALSRFQPLLGLYEVKSVITNNPKENPVGGKWTRSNGVAQKLFTTRATFQHLLPFNATGQSLLQLSSSSSSSSSSSPVAEAVNVVSLDALNGKFRITIVLRGDATPLTLEERRQRNTKNQSTTILSTTTVPTIQLSNLAVRAYFDPPRIYFGKRRRRGYNRKRQGGVASGGEVHGSSSEYSYFPLQLGPASSVILDTTYFDNAVRIGMGGTSGTRFVFASTDKDEADEYEALLKLPYVKKYKIVAMLGLILAASLNVAFPDKLLLGRLCTLRFAAITARWSMWRLVLGTIFRLAGGTLSVMSGMAMLAIIFSSGGIERGSKSRRENRGVGE